MHTQITYAGFCALGGLANPRLRKTPVYLGSHFMFYTYWLRAY